MILFENKCGGLSLDFRGLITETKLIFVSIVFLDLGEPTRSGPVKNKLGLVALYDLNHTS